MLRRNRRWPLYVGMILWLMLGLVALGVTAGGMAIDDTLEKAAPDTADAKAARRTTSPVLPGQKAVNILLIGSDVRQGETNGRSDTLLLVRMDPRNQFISMLSIPRDLLVDIPGHGPSKINAAYSYSTATAIETVKQLIGQPINYYVRVDFQAFATVVNELGGVFIDVDRHYHNVNTGGDSNFAPIDIEPGYQKLNGNDALDYVRFRHYDTTYHRAARQQTFLTELKRQLKDAGWFKNFTTVRKLLGNGIEMNITDRRTFTELLNLAITLPKDRTVRLEIQGSDATDPNLGAIQIATQEEIDNKVAEWLSPQFEASKSVPKAKVPAPNQLYVSVLNGNGQLLSAESMGELLAGKGYNISVGGNADDFEYPNTTVYWTPGMQDAAKRLRNQIGGDTRIAALGRKASGNNDLVVVVGHDFTGQLQPKTRKQQAEERPPADVVNTTSLVAPLREAQREAGFRLMAPTKVPSGTEIKIIRVYRTGIRGKSGAPAVKVVGKMPNQAGEYWGITMTPTENPGILEGETGTERWGTKRTFRTYYDGRNLQRVAFRENGVTYWISNTLLSHLSAKTMEEVIKSMRPLGKAKLPKNVTDTPITVQTEGVTP